MPVPPRHLSVAEPPSSAADDHRTVVALVAFDASCLESLPSWQRPVTGTSGKDFPKPAVKHLAMHPLLIGATVSMASSCRAAAG
jgi:hypothetical protein